MKTIYIVSIVSCGLLVGCLNNSKPTYNVIPTNIVSADSAYYFEHIAPILDSLQISPLEISDSIKVIFLYPELLKRNLVIMSLKDQRGFLQHINIRYDAKADFKGYSIGNLELVKSVPYTSATVGEKTVDLYKLLTAGSRPSLQLGADNCIVNCILLYQGKSFYFSVSYLDESSPSDIDKEVVQILKYLDDQLKISFKEDCN